MLDLRRSETTLTFLGIEDVSNTPNEVWMKESGFMLRFLDSIPYPVLIVAAILMLLAPFEPMPHVAEKLIMLRQGTLTRPIDIFDLFFHLAPSILLVLKVIRDRRQRG